MVIIAIEGPNGAGKTWLCDSLREKLDNVNVKFLKTPFYNDALGECVKKALSGHPEFIPYKDELMYGNWLAGCRELNNGVYIIDRWYDSAILYSGSSEWGKEQDWFFIPKPSMTVVLLPPLDVVLERLNSREERRIYDTEEGYRKVQDYYTDLGLDLNKSNKLQHVEERDFIVLNCEEHVKDFLEKISKYLSEVVCKYGNKRF